LELEGIVEAQMNFLSLNPQEIVEGYVPMQAKAK
jgi:hypothetical protein